jgi:hypothetical protein
MNPNESLDALQARCDAAEAALKEARRELADYAVDMEKANKELAGYKLALSQLEQKSNETYDQSVKMLNDLTDKVEKLEQERDYEHGEYLAVSAALENANIKIDRVTQERDYYKLLVNFVRYYWTDGIAPEAGM